MPLRNSFVFNRFGFCQFCAECMCVCVCGCACFLSSQLFCRFSLSLSFSHVCYSNSTLVFLFMSLDAFLASSKFTQTFSIVISFIIIIILYSTHCAFFFRNSSTLFVIYVRLFFYFLRVPKNNNTYRMFVYVFFSYIFLLLSVSLSLFVKSLFSASLWPHAMNCFFGHFAVCLKVCK